MSTDQLLKEIQQLTTSQFHSIKTNQLNKIKSTQSLKKGNREGKRSLDLQLTKQQQQILKKAMIMSQSLSPKRLNKTKQIDLTQKATKLLVNQLTQFSDKTQNKNRPISPSVIPRQQNGSKSSSKSKKKKIAQKKKITMKKVQATIQNQYPKFNTKENLNILIPYSNAELVQNLQISGSTPKNRASIIKLACQSTKNSNANTFQPLIENTAIRKLQFASKKQKDQKPIKSRNLQYKEQPQSIEEHIHLLKSQLSLGSEEKNQSNERKSGINFQSPQHVRTQICQGSDQKELNMQKFNFNTVSQPFRTQEFITGTPNVSKGIGPGEKITLSDNRAISQSKEKSQKREDSNLVVKKLSKHSTYQFTDQIKEQIQLAISQRETSKNSERTQSQVGQRKIKPTNQNNSNDQFSSNRHQLKIKPPKTTFSNNQISIKTQNFVPQNLLASPPKSTQSKSSQKFLTQITSKNNYNPQTYFQSAQLLNKSKPSQQSNLKSRNSQYNLGGTQPILQNWQSQLGVGFNEVMMGNLSTKNQSIYSSKNKSQNQIIVVPHFSSVQNFEPSNTETFNQIQEQLNKAKQPKAQQLQAAIIKNSILANQKRQSQSRPVIQNNFQVSFTNSFNNHNLTGKLSPQKLQVLQEEEISEILQQHTLDTQKHSSKHSFSIHFENIMVFDQKLTDLLTEFQQREQSQNIKTQENLIQKVDIYLQIFDDLYQRDPVLKPIIMRLKKGIQDTLKDIDLSFEQLRKNSKENELIAKERLIDFKKLEQEFKDLERNEQECRLQVQSMTSQIDERDNEIERLEDELENQQKKNRQLFKAQMQQPKNKKPSYNFQISRDDGSINNQDLIEQLQDIALENNELKMLIKDLQEELDYGKQRENKLMFFLFILKEKGFPISEVFEEEIKDIPTTRFSTHFDDEYKSMYYQIKQERKQAKKTKKKEQNGSFDLDSFCFSPLSERVYSYVEQRPTIKAHTASMLGIESIPYISQSDLSDSNFLPLTVKRAIHRKKPSIVPFLDLDYVKKLQQESSSESESQNSQGKPKRGPNPKQLKKILDRYNIHTCARNLLQQEKEIIKRNKEKNKILKEEQLKQKPNEQQKHTVFKGFKEQRENKTRTK